MKLDESARAQYGVASNVIAPNPSSPSPSPVASRPMAPSTTRDDDTARTAGRGGMAVLGAKVFFIVAGFVQQPLLRFAIGLAAFGELALVLAVANIVNNVVIASAVQGVSRVVAGAPGSEKDALRASFRMHVPIAIVLAVGLVIFAPLYGWFERDTGVVLPLVILAGVTLLYGLYAPLVGYLNGRKRFTTQASLDVAFAVFRTVGLIGVGWLFARRGGSGALGATLGWVAAAACILPLAARATGLIDPSRTPTNAGIVASIPVGRAYLSLLLPIAGAQLFTNLLLQVDLAFLGRFLGEGALAKGLVGDVARDAAKEWAGVYKACQTFAFLPYQLLFSITQVLFPMLARAKAENDEEAVRRYVMRGARLAAIACGLLVGVVVALPGSLLSFAYGPEVAARGASALRVLALGQGAFAMVGIATTVLTSIGRERVAAAMTLGAVVAVGLACTIAVPGAEFGATQIERTAMATTGSLLVTLLVAGAVVRARTGGFVPMATVVRVGVALVACVAAGFYLPTFGKLVTPLVAGGIAVAYLVVLVALREIGGEDVQVLKAVAGRRKAA